MKNMVLLRYELIRLACHINNYRGAFMKTKYSIVKEYIESKVLDGTYQPNQKISSESEFMKQFGVSRHTIRRAIGDLVTEGWLYREQGSGTFCADRSTMQSLRNYDKQKNIAIVTTYLSDYIFPSIIRGAEAQLSEEGYQVSIFSTNNCQDKEKQILENLLTQNFDGVIVEPTKSAYSNPNIAYYLNLERLSIPYIMINAYYDELGPVSIVLDDERGGFLQTKYLIEQGHKDIIGFFKTDDIQGTRRLKGFLKAHRTYKIPINPGNIITYNTDEKDSKPVHEMDQLLTHTRQVPTGIVCYNDELAMNILHVLRTKGLQIPEDVSIIGYDDSPLAEISEVKLTSILHPKSKMGKDAANKIIELIESKDINNEDALPDVESIVYEPEIVIRNSVRTITDSNESI